MTSGLILKISNFVIINGAQNISIPTGANINSIALPESVRPSTAKYCGSWYYSSSGGNTVASYGTVTLNPNGFFKHDSSINRQGIVFVMIYEL